MRRNLATLFALCLFAVPARAQGADDCSNPTTIAGFGAFPFNTLAATDTPLLSGCGAVSRDVWFRWTAPATQDCTVSLCGTAGFDTRLAVYAGSGCPNDLGIACSDDACLLESSLGFAATANSVYVIRLGSAQFASGGVGTFSITAGGCPTAEAGPDLVVSTIHEVGNHATAGVLDAISLGNILCNVGGDSADWHDADTLHPVVGTALYRYEIVDGAGRFEQVGVSWLKHATTAGNGNACCTCTDPLTNQQLGVGCSSTHSAVAMSDQADLAPRWDLIVQSGTFPYPPSNPPYAGETARRLEFERAEGRNSAATGARFFGEAHLFARDQAAAHNRDNDASWAELACAGSRADWSLSIAGATTVGEEAIRAWKQIDPGVVMTTVDDYGAGLHIVASRVTDLKNGLHRYEYAVHNQNGVRAVESFQVPIPIGGTVTNIGFHDVGYRNGDGPGGVDQSGADWTVSYAGGYLLWSAEPAAQNPGANSIRWGTTYNFRFDADAAPIHFQDVVLWMASSGFSPYLFAAAEVPNSSTAPIQVYCSGDGSAATCPCGNAGTAAHGCASSVSGSGAALLAQGSPSISNDTLVLQGSSMPNSHALYFQGTQLWNSGMGAPFGDGLRCVGGSIVRLRTVVNTNGSSQYPGPGDPSISVRGAVAPGQTRRYQAWYRNAAAFCTPSTFNTTNGLQVYWSP